jgi:hypothetical protein
MGVVNWIGGLAKGIKNDAIGIKDVDATAAWKARGIGALQDMTGLGPNLGKAGWKSGNLARGVGLNAGVGALYGGATDDGDNRLGGAFRGAVMGAGLGMASRGAIGLGMRGAESKKVLLGASDRLRLEKRISTAQANRYKFSQTKVNPEGMTGLNKVMTSSRNAKRQRVLDLRVNSAMAKRPGTMQKKGPIPAVKQAAATPKPTAQKSTYKATPMDADTVWGWQHALAKSRQRSPAGFSKRSKVS